MQPDFPKRFLNCQEQLQKRQLDGFLVTNLTNCYYLTGFFGTAATVLLTAKRRVFITDARYTLLAKASVSGFDIIESRTPLKTVAEILQADQVTCLGFEDQVSFAFYQAMQATFTGVTLLAQSGFVEELRLIKDDYEIAQIGQACAISDKAFLDVLDFIKPNQTTELQVANFLDFRMRDYGASGLSFETIVASGYRSAMPHGRATHKVIASGETVTLDFGCYYNHYVSDMTRTIHIGQVTDQERELYQQVLKANQSLIEQAQAGMTYGAFDAAARDVIVQAGYGDQFTHGIGHGIGLDIHEDPFFNHHAKKLQAGMVVTDEPGIYLDGAYGVRIEDDLVITKEGCQVLTLAPKELIVL
ncbi:M24 family metallopeptidase [Streptococcus halichoeri]|uniref:M24 family metallopeptidase n=1 Tax=Streptococcus halichoeri TaxID=254785 RepID=UPI00135BE34F|nr:Xaa-Pro peptidase family protein [Streptococcus halichoeri]